MIHWHRSLTIFPNDFDRNTISSTVCFHWFTTLAPSHHQMFWRKKLIRRNQKTKEEKKGDERPSEKENKPSASSQFYYYYLNEFIFGALIWFPISVWFAGLGLTRTHTHRTQHVISILLAVRCKSYVNFYINSTEYVLARRARLWFDDTTLECRQHWVHQSHTKHTIFARDFRCNFNFLR